MGPIEFCHAGPGPVEGTTADRISTVDRIALRQDGREAIGGEPRVRLLVQDGVAPLDENPGPAVETGRPVAGPN